MFITRTCSLFASDVYCDVNSNIPVVAVHSIGRGRIAQIDLANVEGGLALHAADEARDISAQYLIRFPPLHPNTLVERCITLKNPMYALAQF